MKIVLIAFILLFVGCRELRDFPVHEIFEVVRGKPGCTRYPVTKDDPLTFGNGTDLPEDQCPDSVIGFHYQDVAEVTDWIRDAQKTAKAKCK
jgi:hypothetical protein